MRRKPNKVTIESNFVGVMIWGCLGFKTCVPCIIKNNHPKHKLHGAGVYITGPGKSYVKKAKVIDRKLIVKNKTLMVRIKTMETKSKFFKEGDELEILPKYLRSAW